MTQAEADAIKAFVQAMVAGAPPVQPPPVQPPAPPPVQPPPTQPPGTIDGLPVKDKGNINTDAAQDYDNIGNLWGYVALYYVAKATQVTVIDVYNGGIFYGDVAVVAPGAAPTAWVDCGGTIPVKVGQWVYVRAKPRVRIAQGPARLKAYSAR